MTTEALVRQSHSPQEAMLVIARALDRVEAALDARSESGGWDTWGDLEPQRAVTQQDFDNMEVHVAEHALRVDSAGDTDGENVVHLPPVTLTEEHMEARRMFERQSLKIGEYLNEPDESDVYNERYVTLGPLWLYHGNRQLVMDQPKHTRQAMVQDLIDLGLLKDAHEMSADILKEDFEIQDVGAGDGAIGGNHVPVRR